MDYLDYSEARFSFVGVRKHFFQDKQYFVTVFDDCFLMGTTANSQQPKYIIKYGFNTKIKWNIKKCKQGLLVESFCFPYKQNMKAVYASNEDLLKFKELISLKVTFEGILDLYSSLHQIGYGCSAKVYSATNLFDQQIYAIKAIEKQFLKQQHESGQAAFKMEVSVLKTLAKYPENFITLKEIYEGEQLHYLVTSYLEGLSLTQEFELLKSKDQQRFPIETVKQIMWKLLQNLDILHSHKIIHRDLKPENLMFQKKNDYTSLVLVDFGLATSESMEKFLFPKCGTPGFVAPEIFQIKSETKYTTKVDIFSCGCIFYKLITGSYIFGGVTFEEALKQNKQCLINFNLQPDQYITEQSINLLQLMLLKNPRQRISAKIALQHSFFEQMNLFHQVPSSKSSTKVYLNIKQGEQFSDFSDDEEVNNEKSLEECQQISLPKSKKCSLMGDFLQLSQSPSKHFLDIQQFYQSDPLFGIRCIKVSQSPYASQVLE